MVTKPLKKFQEDAVHKVVNNLLEQIEEAHTASTIGARKRNRLGVLKSPTGSGKTLMISSVIEELDKIFGNTAYIVFSPGSGGLEMQTVNAFKNFFSNKTRQVKRWSIDNLSDPVNSGDVMVLSWESAVSVDRKTGERKNKIARDNENIQIFDKIADMVRQKMNIVLIIDEAHHGSSKSATQIRSFLQDIQKASLDAGGSFFPVLEASATPMSKDYDYSVKVSYDEAINAGLLRNKFVLNDGIENITEQGVKESDVETLLLSLAVERQKKLQNIIVRDNISQGVPLIGIQLPNGVHGKELLEQYQNILTKDFGFSEDEIGVFMDANKTENIVNIASNESPVKILFYKQAIATGWDCPRAQILVGFRDSKSTIFQTQNLGRYLRTAQARHYDIGDSENFADLNRMYVYSTYSQVDIMNESPELVGSGLIAFETMLNLRQDVQTFVDDFNSYHLPRSYVASTKTNKLRGVMQKIIKLVHEEHGASRFDTFDHRGNSDGITLRSGSVNVSDLDDDNVSIVHTQDAIEVKYGKHKVDNDFRDFVDAVFREHIQDHELEDSLEIKPVVTELSGKLIASYFIQNTGMKVKDLTDAKRLLLTPHNKNIVAGFIEDVVSMIDECKIDGTLDLEYRRVYKTRTAFALPEKIQVHAVSEHLIPGDRAKVRVYGETVENSWVSYHPEKLSEPEKMFEEMLSDKYSSNNPQYELVGIHKMRAHVHDENMSMAISLPIALGKNRFGETLWKNFFPDYLLFFRNKYSNRVFPMIAEVKGNEQFDNKTPGLLQAKTNACANYMKHTGLPMAVFIQKANDKLSFVNNENKSESFDEFLNKYGSPHIITFNANNENVVAPEFMKSLAENPLP